MAAIFTPFKILGIKNVFHYISMFLRGFRDLWDNFLMKDCGDVIVIIRFVVSLVDV
jgi:hypothetical protein